MKVPFDHEIGKMSTTFWLTIARITQHTDALRCTLSLFDRAPTAALEPIHQLTRPSHSRLTSQARKQVDAGQDAMQAYGNALAQWVFGSENQVGSLNPIGEHLKLAASGAHESPRVRLFVCVESSLSEKIEFLYHGFFQCLSANTIVPLEAVRSVVKAHETSRPGEAAPMPPVADQLRVLVVLSNPDERQENTAAGFEHLPSLEEDFSALIASLTPLQHHQAIFLEELRQPSGEQLEARLQDFNPHVFVFLGHGYHDVSGFGGSGLVCVEQGRAQKWPYDRLKHAHGAIPSGADLRLVVLMACRSFVAAPGLLSLGIPAVMGMQKYGTEDFPAACVKPFAEPVFRALADFKSVAVAFAQGVQGIRDPQHREMVSAESAQTDGNRLDGHDPRSPTFPAFAAVMPTLWLAGAEDQLFAESERRMRASYRRALSSKLSTCEWSGRPGQLPLMQVFVPPPLLDTSTGQPVDLETTLSKNRALVLQGLEWSGKTTVAHWWVLSIFDRDHLTPILVNLREMERDQQSLDQWLVDTCRRWLGLHSAEAVAGLIMEDCRKGKAVLVIDDVEHRWVVQPLNALRHRLFGEQGANTTMSLLVTSKEWEQGCHPEWVSLRIEPLSAEQQRTVVQRYGEFLEVVPATRDFLQRIAAASEQSDGVTPLAGRSGFWTEMLAQFIRQMVLLTDESDLLERLQQNRWRKPVESTQMIHPDEPVYKQRMLEALGFHLYCCGRGAGREMAAEVIMPTLLHSVLQHMDLGEGPIYPPDVATQLLDEHVDIRPMLQRTAAGWAFRSAEWRRFYAASQLAASVNGQDPAVLAWIEDGKSLHCRSCDTNLGTFEELVTPERMEQVLAAVAAARAEAEELPAWRRTDPWDCPAVPELRRVLVRALPLNPIARGARTSGSALKTVRPSREA